MLAAGFVTFAVASVLTPVLAAWARRRNFLDVPNDRSSHVIATPRIGGAALVVAVLTGLIVFRVLDAALGFKSLIVLGGSVAIAVLGLIDDFRHLPAVARLVVQTLAAIAVVAGIGPAPLPWLDGEGPVAAFITVFWIVALTNAYNFMDGIDGIAGGQALVGGIGWMTVGLLTGSREIAALGLVLAAASCGFLLHNWQPAKVFMGDAGAGFLGFLFAALPLLAPPGQVSAWWVALLLMWPFLFDTGFTFLRRASRGENVLSPHRSHIYQRLVLTGRSHSHVSALYIGLAVLGAVMAMPVVRGDTRALLAAAIVITVAAASLWSNLIAREAADGSS
jgi:UDP-N-acetylmuramyl pentapeptide phosphotransferase/UDP-N-acetylglucosamine-1-phosphate transferase